MLSNWSLWTLNHPYDKSSSERLPISLKIRDFSDYLRFLFKEILAWRLLAYKFGQYTKTEILAFFCKNLYGFVELINSLTRWAPTS